jgi:hypothetical protein
MALALGVVLCASCACGDPTLTTMGTEKPFDRRLRVSTEVRYQEARAGEPGVDEITRTDLRIGTAVAWFPTRWAALALDVPLVARTASTVTLARERTFSLGDIELRAKLFVWSDRRFSPTHLVSLVGGVKLPTAPELEEDGVAVNDDAQPGTGSTDPLAGAAYSYFGDVIKVFASSTVVVPTRGHHQLRGGTQLLTTVAVEWQPSGQERWALFLAADTRLEGAMDEMDHRDPDSGGFVGYLCG